MTRSRSATVKTGRKPLTKEMLLPLPAAKVRAMSLENHLALATLRSGQGDSQQMLCLLKIVYLSYFLRQAGPQCGEIETFRAAEVALQHSISRAERGNEWSLSDADQGALETILGIHDQQIAAVPLHVYEAAWARLQRFVQGDATSPIQSGAPG